MTSTTKPGGPTESFEFQELPRAATAGAGAGTGTAPLNKTKTKIKVHCPSGETIPLENSERDRGRHRTHSQPLNNYYSCIEQKASEEALFNWLYSLQLIHYFEKFLDHGYEDLGICMEIGETDLHAIGVSDIHERLALLQAVRQLRQQNQNQTSAAGNPTGTNASTAPISKISDFHLYNKYEYEFSNSTNNPSSVSIFGGGKKSKNNKMQIKSIPLWSISSTQGHTTIPTICSSWGMPQHFESPANNQSQTARNKKKSSAQSSGSSSSPFGFSFSLRSKKSFADTKSSTTIAAAASSQNGKKSTDDIIIMDQYGCDWKSNSKNYQSQILAVNVSNGKNQQEKILPQFTGAKRPTHFKTQLPPQQSFINSGSDPNPNIEPAIGIAALTNNGLRKSQFSQFAIHPNSKLPPLPATCYPLCMSSSVSSNLRLNPHGFLHGGGSGSVVALNTIGAQPPIPGPGPPPPPCSRRNLQLRNSNFPPSPPPPLPLHLNLSAREFQKRGSNGGNLRKIQLASKLCVQSSPGEEIMDHPNYVDVNENGEVVEPLYETVSPVRAVPRPGPVQHLRDFHHVGFGFGAGHTYHHGRGHHHDDMCGYSIPMNNFSMSRSTPITPKKQQKNVSKNSHHIINNNNSHHVKNQIQSQSSCCHNYDDENVGDSNLNSTNNCQSFPCCGGGSVADNGKSGSVSGSVPNSDHRCQQSSVNLVLLRSQLRDQVMQDGINISRISDESILRTMAAQYAAELASTLTLTPSSNSACSSSTSTSSNSSCVSAPLSHQSASSSAASSSGASSNSSGSCTISGRIISASTPTPADLHYQQVYHQLRELWLEERMKLFPVIQHPHNYSLDSPSSVSVNSKSLGCTCGPATGQSQGQGIFNFKNPNAPHIPSPLGLGLGFPFKSSSCSSTPAVTTPTGAGPGHNPNSIGTNTGTDSPAGLLFHGNGNASSSECGAKILSAGVGPASENNVGGSNSNLNSKSSAGCKSPKRSVGQHQHQYLQHVIISNSSFGQQQSHNFMSESNSNLNKSSQSNNSSSSHICEGGNGAASATANNTSTSKQTYKPGIYLPSSCLLDKDEIYDYAPPVRFSPERVINNNSDSKTSQNLYSPSKRCFVGQKGGLTSPRHSNGNVSNGNGIATIRGSSKSSYALTTDHRGTLKSGNNNSNSIYGPGGKNTNYAHLSPGSAGLGEEKTGCQTLTMLSKFSQRLGLSRLFRTLRVHGNGNSESTSYGAGTGTGAGAESNNGKANFIGRQDGNGSGNCNGRSMTRTSNPSFCGSSGRTNTNDMCGNENYLCGGDGNGNGARASHFHESHLNSELNSISQRLYGSSFIEQNQNQRFSQTNNLPDLTLLPKSLGIGTKIHVL